MPDYDAFARAISDPQGAAEIWRIKLDMAVKEFSARRMSDDVFRAVLFGLGFRGARLVDEFRYHESNRRPPV
jgi:hypothetical protein